ncbi:MAG: AAA family ATPase, partial [Candidatus Paceibacterota bacterium]
MKKKQGRRKNDIHRTIGYYAMIKRVSHIKKAGIFKNYRRSGDIQDFKRVNIIYGWNYSGKTTLSRLFHCLQKKEVVDSLKNCEFEFIDYEDQKTDEASLIDYKSEVRIFNSDFIKNNLSWDGESFNPILLLGEESIEAKNEIANKQQKIERVQELKDQVKEVYTSLENQIEDGLTATAKDITTKLGLVQQFTKTHLRPIFTTLQQENHKSFKLDDAEEDKLLGEAKVSEDDKLPRQNQFSFNLTLKNLLEESKPILKEVPTLSQTIDFLRENKEVADWVEKGLVLHEEKDNCEFCGNEIRSERKSKLLAHFSEDLKNHKRKVEQLLTNIESAKIELPQLIKRDFYKSFRKEFEEAYKDLQGEIESYNELLSELYNVVKTKQEKSFEAVGVPDFFEDNSTSVNEKIQNLNEIISQNNNYTNQFDEKKAEAAEKLKKHYTACFIEDINLSKKEEKIGLYKEREIKLADTQGSVSDEISELEAKISKAQLGKEQLNKYIERFLGRDEIKVDVVTIDENERFILQRNEEKALNLSEGEKTAIAFSFFLVKLLEIENFKNTIVFIDDPISSLDSNHIFQINALIKDFFFDKKDENSSWELTCDQLFISTHNFDFFSLLRELPRKRKPNDHEDLQHSFYHVKRINEEEAEITKLPKAIEKYTSEYHFLFEQIFHFHNSDNKADYDVLMNIPNAVRRFIELYTYSRLPGNKSSTVDQRANKLWGQERSKRILKVFHYFSHSNNIDRMLKNSDLLCDIEYAVDDLITELKKDHQH